MARGNNWSIPAGMRDWLPPEAGEKRELINCLLQKMGLWGYEEIATPLLEHYHVLVKGESGVGPDHLYKLIERDGSILALRPEMTTPIARVVGSKMIGTPPWRLMYGAQVFRYEDIQAGRQREFSQVGVELIGQRGPEADSEVLALAIEALRESGLQHFTVSLGHTGVLGGLLESLSWEEESLDTVRNLVLEKDFAGLHHFLERAGLENRHRENLVGLLTQPLAAKDLATLSNRLPSGMEQALQEIKEIIELVKAYGYESFLQIDLSTLRSQNYYSGMVFEIYTPGLGYPIGGGGRYDRLLRHFGRDLPATGFALGVERLMLSLPRAAKPERPVLVAAEGPVEKAAPAAVAAARRLRNEGRRVMVELRKMTRQQAEELAREQDAELVWRRGEDFQHEL